MKRIFVVLLLLVAGCFETDPATYPQNRERHQGSDQVHIGPATAVPVRRPADPTTAAFRTDCRVSHASHADPIVKPPVGDQPGGWVGHLHSFFGNTLTGRNSTSQSIATTGSSTCEGGIANRSAYWVPSMLDTSGEEPYPVVSHGPSNDQDSAGQFYYKSGYDGVLPLASDYGYTVSPSGWVPRDIQPIPEGLKIIAGNSKATAPQTTNNTVRWHCAAGPGSNQGEVPGSHGFVMPTCQPGFLLLLAVAFGQCWDGVNLDSPDHKSHLAYGVGWPDKGCPPSHPVPLPQLTQNYRWRVPATGMANWRLSSDVMMGAAPGVTSHADYVAAWDPAIQQRWIDTCYRVPSSGPRDCQLNLIGDGEQLTYP